MTQFLKIEIAIVLSLISSIGVPYASAQNSATSPTPPEESSRIAAEKLGERVFGAGSGTVFPEKPTSGKSADAAIDFDQDPSKLMEDFSKDMIDATNSALDRIEGKKGSNQSAPK